MNVDATVEEEVFLASSEEEEQPKTVGRDVLAAVHQRHPLRGSERELTLLSGHLLRVRTSARLGRSREFLLKLAFLAPEPQRRRRMPWRLLAAGVICLLGAGALPWTAASPAALALGTGGLVLTAVVLLICSACRYRDELVFNTQHGGLQVLRVSVRRGERREALGFLARVQKQIRQARDTLPRDSRSVLAEEMREHRRLLRSGAITDADYELAKERLLARH